MKVNIEFDSSTATSEDHQLLNRLVEAINGMPATPSVETKSAPAKKSKVNDAPATNKKSEVEDDEVVEAEVIEDEPAEDDAESLMEQAVQKATKLVSDGKASEVKAALEKAGARRVSELKDVDSIRIFLDAL